MVPGGQRRCLRAVLLFAIVPGHMLPVEHKEAASAERGGLCSLVPRCGKRVARAGGKGRVVEMRRDRRFQLLTFSPCLTR